MTKIINPGGDQTRDEAADTGAKLTGAGSDLWKVTEHVERPARRIPVVYDVDVVVAGGGIAGIIAALAAARYGAKTLVVEAFGVLGGNMGPGMFAGGALHLALHHAEAFPNGLCGIAHEFNDRVVEGQDRKVGSDYFRDSAAVPYVAAKMFEEAGVDVLLSSVVSGVIKEHNAVRGVFVENKSGTAAIKAKVVIDCTGTADVADLAGAPLITLETDPSMGSFFAIMGVDRDAYQRALAKRSELTADDKEWLSKHAPGTNDFMPWVRQAWEAGEFRIVETVDNFATLEVTPKPPQDDPPMMRCRTRVNGNFNPGDGLALSRIQDRMCIYIYEYAKFLNTHVPGFENSYLHVVSPFFHARGGKSIDSEYVVTTENDVWSNARFDDVTYIFYSDKPDPQGQPCECDIPYRLMVPKQIDGLLAAGRSAVRRGPQIRVRHSVQLMGQAAGVAAALAVKHNVEPRNVDVKELQRILHSLGSEMGPPDRLKELGLV